MKNRRQRFANPGPRNKRLQRKRKTGQKHLGIESLEIRRLLYGEPIGGWDYIYHGDAAADGGNFTSLDGTWSHDNGSDEWDGTAPGAGKPGGAGTYIDPTDGSIFLRIQDTGDPRDHGFGDPSNRKILFGHDIGSDGAAGNVIDTGVTLTFRTRLSTAPNVDNLHPNNGGATSAWPSNGDGYDLSFNGKANFVIHQNNGGTIGFSLANVSDGAIGSSGLLMNNLNGTALSGNIDTGEAGTHNQFDVADATDWHDFWITIQAGGAGTHQVTVYADGDLNGTTFDVTGGTGGDYTGITYISMGTVNTNDSGAIDVDYFGWKNGALAAMPDGPVEPPTVINTPAAFVTATTADIGGEITDDGGQFPDVTVYFGDEDGGTDTDNWDQEISLGQKTGPFVTIVEDLTPNTTYYYRSLAINLGGQTWTATTESFTTQSVSLAVIQNAPAQDIGAVSATLGGVVTDSGNDPPEVTVYYGDEDGGTSSAAWDHSVTLAGKQSGPFSVGVANLDASTSYFFRARATNLAGDSWAANSATFTTTDIPSELVINEFLTDNGGTLVTRTRATTGEAFSGPQTSPDWIEIRNLTSTPLDLGGLHLTDDDNDMTKWTFPGGTQIAPNGFLIVFASGQNITDPALDEQGSLHTNFRLANNSSYLGLTGGAGEMIQEYEYPSQFTDITYGVDDNFSEFFFDTPTPGSANNQGRLVVDDTAFSVDRGFYDEPFTTAITTSTAGATIVYTLDGSAPTVSNQGNVTNGTVYTAPIPITTTTTLRAMAVKSGMLPSNIDAQTYIFAADVLQQDGSGLPAHRSWGHAGPDWEMDPEVVELPANDPNRVREEDLQAIPTVSLVMNWNDMFGSNGIYPAGEGVPRATSFEYFDPQTGDGVQATASVEIQGGSSTGRWKTDKISMRVRFKEPFGPTKLNYPIFGDNATDTFDTLNIDAQLNYVWPYGNNNTQRSNALYIHDQVVADLHNAIAGEGASPHARFIHLYINGVYWGMHYLHERPDESFGAEYYGGDKQEYHAINQNRSINNGINPDGSPTGNDAARNDLDAMVSKAGAAGNGGLAEWNALTEVLDVDHFIDYLLINWYTGNGDWGDTKNWYATRRNTPDGRWRFHSWDAEKAFENFSSGGRDDVGNGPKGLHGRLMGSEHYRLLFADQIQRHMFNDGLLTAEGAMPFFQARVDEIERAVTAESARWGDNRESREYVRSDLMANFDRVFNSFFPNRTERVLNQLRSEGLIPDVEPPTLHINGQDQHGGPISVGDVLSMTSATGVVRDDTVIFTQGNPVLALIPTNGSLETGNGPFWYEPDFVPVGWTEGTSGVGYADSEPDAFDALIGTDLEDDWNLHETSIYARFEFDVNAGDLANADALTLRMKYDDGFVAYLNGELVASDRAPSPATWNSNATGNRGDSSSLSFADFDITDDISLLNTGTNLLAIHGLNTSDTSSDMLFLPELVVTEILAVGNSPIYFTLDGSDPRAADGTAVGTRFTGEFALEATTSVNARSFVNGEWSALTAATFIAPAGPQDIMITEINYNPHDPTPAEVAVIPALNNDDFEFIEIHNGHPTDSFNLLDMQLTDGVEFTFPNATLDAGEYAVVVEDTAAFQVRYGPSIRVLGQWSGGLSNNGETIELVDGIGDRIVEIDYRDGDPWAGRADGFGASLELTSPATTPTPELGKHYRWQGSSIVYGTPGEPASEPVGVVVNEVQTRTETGVFDAIELRNTTNGTIDIGGWFLSDAGQSLFKYEIPAGTSLRAGELIVFDESDFNPTPDNPAAHHFGLSGTSGDDVWLTVSDGNGNVSRFVDDVHFGAALVGETLGRVPDGTGRLVPMGRATIGCENLHSRVGPLVVSEVNYNPGEPSAAAIAMDPNVVEDDLEFVEIHNPTSAAVDLTDWRLRGGADYDFAAGMMLGSGQSFVIISFDPNNENNDDRLAAFRAHYGIGPAVTLLGGYAGQLSDSGEAVRLLRADTPSLDDPLTIPHTTEDEVLFDDLVPWATTADGDGDSLQRLAPIFFGSAATSWQAATPSPGSVSFTGNVSGDVTGDGLLTATDIDIAFDAAVAANAATYMDLDGSGTVDQADATFLVRTVIGTQFGDANLDGVVDGSDFNRWNDNRFETCGKSWAHGDFSGDGLVDGTDLNSWFANRFEGMPLAARVASRARRAALPARAADTAESTKAVAAYRSVDDLMAELDSLSDVIHPHVSISNDGFARSPVNEVARRSGVTSRRYYEVYRAITAAEPFHRHDSKLDAIDAALRIWQL